MTDAASGGGRTVILVPRRDGFPDRDRIWAWCRDWWSRELSMWPIVEGHHTTGLFNRSAAINTAARLAGDWDTAVIIDSDVICDPHTAIAAAARAGVENRMILPFTVRKDLNERGTQLVMNGYKGSWDRYVHKRYTDGCSSVVCVGRELWDAVGGFDEAFQGWGYEDNAFRSAALTFGAGDMLTLKGEVWHFYHKTAKEGRRGTPSWMFNSARSERYRTVQGQPDLIRAIQQDGAVLSSDTVIPRILHRVVPEQTVSEAEGYWQKIQDLHPEWRYMTHRDPLDPAEWPITAPYWHLVSAGAQLADLVRLEALLRWGGVYVDQDYEPYRAFDPLLGAGLFAAYEDRNSIPNAVLGASADHPAITQCLDLAIDRLRAGKGIWDVGPGVLTSVLPHRKDVLLLPPGTFYPYHYKEKERAGDPHWEEQPWAFGAHHWWGSWL